MQSTKRARMAIFLTVFVDLLGFGIVIPILPLYAQAIADHPSPWMASVNQFLGLGGAGTTPGAFWAGVGFLSFSLMQFIASALDDTSSQVPCGRCQNCLNKRQGMRDRLPAPGLVEAAKAVPLVGTIVGVGLLGHDAFVYGSLLAVGAVWWLLYRTRFGLRLRAAGENPAMIDAAGVSVLKLRYAALMLNGVLSALAGSYLVLALTPSFIPNMTAGRGYMALAAMIFGKWHPVGALLACLLFGLAEAVSIRMQGTVNIPNQFILMIPYVLTIVMLAGLIRRADPPKALGVAYAKE